LTDHGWLEWSTYQMRYDFDYDAFVRLLERRLIRVARITGQEQSYSLTELGRVVAQAFPALPDSLLGYKDDPASRTSRII
jgi:hypothetical protein